MKRILAVVITLVIVLTFTIADGAGIFQKCSYLNDCETFATEFTVKNYKEGILVEGVIPDADLSTSGNPLEVIVTTGDVYTRCSNSNGVKDITGDLLYRGNVVPGYFSAYIPLSEGVYNVTAALMQSVCANCPQAWVHPIEVKHHHCEWGYKLIGNYPCYLRRNDNAGDQKAQLPLRYNGTEYMQGLCNLVDRECLPDVTFKWSGKWATYCEPIPPCTACP